MRQHEIPPRAVPQRDDTYLEILTQAVFQAGFSWQVVRAKWPHFRQVFKGFRIVAVARFTPRDVERLVKDPGLIRNARKIRATVDNARMLAALAREHGSVKAYIKSLRRLPYRERVRGLSRRFAFLGPTGVYFFLWSVGEEVPRWQDRDPDRPGLSEERPSVVKKRRSRRAIRMRA